MANETTIEQARNRIQRLVEEIAALSSSDLTSEEFFQKFLDRVVAATDAKGGAVWLVASRGQDNSNEFQLCAHANFESSLFQSDENQRAAILKILTSVVQSKRALVLAPEQPSTLTDAAPGTNRTPFAFLHVPLFLKDQTLGVLQVWLQAYVTPENYPEFVTFLATLGSYVEQHLQSRRLGNLVLETQRLQHLLRFTTDLAGSLDALEIGRLTVNYGRDLVGCERASLLLLDGDRWKVIAISGQEVVEKKSAMVKAMSAFVSAHCRKELQVLSKKELLARAGVDAATTPDSTAALEPEAPASKSLDAGPTDRLDLAYFQLSHVVSAVVVPLFDADKQLAGALFFESTSEGYFESPQGKTEPPASRRIAEWIGNYAGRALIGARDYQSLPLLPISQKLRAGRLRLTGAKKRRTLLKTGITVAALLILSFWPAKVKVDGNCTLMPIHRTAVVPEIPGRVDRVFVREGDRVKKGQEIAQLDTNRLKTELDACIQEKQRYLAEVDRYRALNDEASAQVSMLQASISDGNEKRIKADIASATLRSPLDGAVLTKDLELHAGEFLQAGSPFAEIAGIDSWELQVEVNEKEIGAVENALNEHRQIDVNFILYSITAHKLHARLESRQQISAAAYPREKENVFIVTIKNPEIPSALINNLRPGLTGRAKIEMGHRPLLFVIARKVFRWFQFRWIG